MKKLRIDVWSDIACPWCYVGKRRLESALASFPQRDAVEVVWRAFELDPSAPRERDPAISYAERLARKYGLPLPRAQEMIRRNAAVAKTDGLDFQTERMRSGNTFDAHRLVHLGALRGVQDAVKERIMRAYFTEGQLVSDHETLVRLGSEAGLDPEEIREMLASDAHAAEVRADEQEAHDLGIGGVPFFVLGGRYGISGAQPAELLLKAITRAWEEAGEDEDKDEAAPAAEGQDAAPPSGEPEGEVCGPDGCAVPPASAAPGR